MSYILCTMNWDWEKLQEKRQRQPGWNAGGKGNGSENEPRSDNRNSDSDNKDNSGRQDNADGRGWELHSRKSSGPSGPSGPFGNDPMRKMREVRLPGLKWLVLVAIALWLLTGIYIIQPNEEGVVLRFGEYVRTVSAGPHYHLPYPIEEVYKPNVTQIRQAEVGFRSLQTRAGDIQAGRTQPVEDEAAMLTGDENIINIQFSIQYRIKPGGAVDFLFNVNEPDAVVKNAAEAAMREVIGNNLIDSALTDGKIKIQNDVADLLQSILDRYQVGVEVVGVQMQDVQPPREVSDAFKDVASAREDKVRITNEAEAYSMEVLPRARGIAAEVRNQAEAYKQTRIMAAEGDSQRFLAVLAEYSKAEDVTRKRLLYETLEEVLSQPGMEKLILPSNVGQRVLPLLPLDSMNSGPEQMSAAPGTLSSLPGPSNAPAAEPVPGVQPSSSSSTIPGSMSGTIPGTSPISGRLDARGGK